MRRSAGWVLTALVLGVLAAPQGASAQFGNGQKYLGVHVGMSGVGSTAAFGASGEMAYNEKIGIGVWFDMWSYDYEFSTFNSSTTYMAFAGTGAYHFPVKSAPKWDPFVGLALGYYVVSYSDDVPGGVDAAASRIFLGGFGGARYFFKPNISGVARLGFGASYLTLGVDFKL